MNPQEELNKIKDELDLHEDLSALSGYWLIARVQQLESALKLIASDSSLSLRTKDLVYEADQVLHTGPEPVKENE